MKYLVTGGAGFIGSHLVDRLLNMGDEVVVIDNFSTGSRKNLPNHRRLTVQTIDILDHIRPFFDGVDVVFHLAAQTRPQLSFSDWELTNTVNVQGTLNVLQASIRSFVKRIVFMSSTAVYGEQEIYPTEETATPHLMSPYAVTKMAGEMYCQMFGNNKKIEYNIIRPFNVYGPRQSPQVSYAAAVPTFINNLLSDRQCMINGDGNQSRDFIYVDDVVDLLVKASDSKINGEAFNAGSGASTPIMELYKTIQDLLGKHQVPTYGLQLTEPRTTWGNIVKAKEMLGWKPKTILKDGLQLTINSML